MLTDENQNTDKKLGTDFFKTKILPAEEERIRSIRKMREYAGFKLADDASHIGLALSGGGIRSAAFGLGVLHALWKRNVLLHIDYLSTVSGGGYIGAGLTYLMALDAQADKEDRKKLQFGLGTRWIGAKTDESKLNLYLDHIRGHGKYLTQGDHLGFGSVVAMLLRAIFFGLVIWLPLAALGLAVIVLLTDTAASYGASIFPFLKILSFRPIEATPLLEALPADALAGC